jgi:hypothetical protein
MALWLYLKAVVKHWWALMSCALFTLLGLYIAYANKSNDWTVRGILGLAVLLLLVACFLAWRDEHRKVVRLEKAIESKRDQLQGRYEDNRPVIGMRVTHTIGAANWRDLTSGALIKFYVRHLHGRPATSLSPCTVSSLGGNYTLSFFSLPFLANGDEQEIDYEVWKNGETLSRRAREVLNPKRLFGEFILDGVGPITALFRDGNEFISQSFSLTFDETNYHLEIIENSRTIQQSTSSFRTNAAVLSQSN